MGLRASTSAPIYVANNIILGGIATNSYGFTLGDRALIVNNTIGAVGGTDKEHAINTCGTACTLRNNVLFTAGASARYAIYSAFSADQVAVMQNNLFLAAPDGFYRVVGVGSFDLDGIHARDGTDLPTPSGCTAGVDCDEFAADSNITMSGFIDGVFVDWDGPDDDPRTWEDNDFRVASMDPSVIGAGAKLDGGGLCGTASDPLTCRELLDDIDGQARTCAGGAPPSCYCVGAFEQD